MLNKILEQQKIEFAERTAEPYISRSLTIPPDDNDLIKVILGPRRTGKSFLAKRLGYALIGAKDRETTRSS